MFIRRRERLTAEYRTFLRVKFANSVRVARINDSSRCRITSIGYAVFIQWNQLGIVERIKFLRNEFAVAKAAEANGGIRRAL